MKTLFAIAGGGTGGGRGAKGGNGGHRGGSRKRRRSRGIFGEKLCQGEYISIRLENAKLGLGSSDGLGIPVILETLQKW